MSFFITIETEPIDNRIADSICKKVNSENKFKLDPIRKFKLFGKGITTIFNITPSEEFISDGHDPNEDILKTDSDKLELLISTIEDFYHSAKHAFSILFAWGGEKCIDEQRVSLREFLNIIRENKIRNKVKYLIE